MGDRHYTQSLEVNAGHCTMFQAIPTSGSGLSTLFHCATNDNPKTLIVYKYTFLANQCIVMYKTSQNSTYAYLDMEMHMYSTGTS